MRRFVILFTLILLSACGGAPSQPSGNGGSGNSSVASLSSTPAPENFRLGKGETATLSVTVSRKTADLAKLELTSSIGPVGVDISPSSHTVEFEEGGPDTLTVEFTVSVESSISNPKPDFYIYGKALDSRGRSIGSETLRLKYQWSL